MYLYKIKYCVTIDISAGDPTWDFTEMIIWTSVECNVALVSACLPCLRPLWVHYRGGPQTTNAPSSYRATKPSASNFRSMLSTFRSNRGDEGDFQELTDVHGHIEVVTDISVRSDSVEGHIAKGHDMKHDIGIVA